MFEERLAQKEHGADLVQFVNAVFISVAMNKERQAALQLACTVFLAALRPAVDRSHPSGATLWPSSHDGLAVGPS